jgi:hypothetical protein
MVTLCWAAKGGSGTTVVTTTLALESTRPALLVDLAGDIPAVLGMVEPDRPGVADWLDSDGAPTQLDDLLVDIDDLTVLLPYREQHHSAVSRPGDLTPARWRALGAWLEAWAEMTGGEVWIDGGTGTPATALAACVEQLWLITRPCYLSLRQAARGAVRPTGVVLVDEPGRSLRVRDVERATAAPVVTRLLIDPRVARAVDAGLLMSRPPFTIRRSLRRAAA